MSTPPTNRFIARPLASTLLLSLFLLGALSVSFPSSSHADAPIRLPVQRPQAPEFPTTYQWLNTPTPLSIQGNLKGHVIVLDFWTYCCINCLHILPDLAYLEKKYAGQPVAVIGVHSAKFETERDPENIRQAIQRYRIEHPVIVDQNSTIWRQYQIRAWPSFMIIDPEGQVVGTLVSEGNRDLLDKVIAQLLEEGKAKKTLAKTPMTFSPIDLKPSGQPLAFPGKITADPANRRLIISDSNNDRLLITTPDGQILHTIGSGKKGHNDGDWATASFANPQGTLLDGDQLYVADTDNHLIRQVNLTTKRVTTLSGNGQRSYDRQGGGAGTQQGLASPWALSKSGDQLIIAMAGTHQLWTYNLKTKVAKQWVGSGREHITDGAAQAAALAQPSGLTRLGDWIYFADSEGSAIRRAAINDGRVETLIGNVGDPSALFTFGDRDGPLKESLLQHALGITTLDKNTLIIADTYNDKLKKIDLTTKQSSTLYGGQGELDEPCGVAVLDGIIYIADTNQHRIVRFDPTTQKATPLTITPATTKEK